MVNLVWVIDGRKIECLLHFVAQFNPISRELHTEPTMTRDRSEPTLLATSGDNMEWTQIEFGASHTAAVTKEGALLTWGGNGWGHLGHGDLKTRDTPTRVSKLDGFVIRQVSCGHRHMAVLTDKGHVLTW